MAIIFEACSSLFRYRAVVAVAGSLRMSIWMHLLTLIGSRWLEVAQVAQVGSALGVIFTISRANGSIWDGVLSQTLQRSGS
jgi:hypothetical protein